MAPADGRRPYIELEELVEKQAPTFGYQVIDVRLITFLLLIDALASAVVQNRRSC